MKQVHWWSLVSLALVVLSISIYLVHYLLFRDVHHIFIYGVGDLAFLPIEVLLVTVIIHRLLGAREKRNRMEKLNMVIGAFFSEAGTRLLTYLSDFDPNLEVIRKDLIFTEDWSDKEFLNVSKRLRNYDYDIEVHRVNLENLRSFLIGKRDFLLRLLENPTLMEHETFTDLLQAVFHLTEELASRGNVIECSDTDCKHLSVDIKRVYVLLVHEWLAYMGHLKAEYPYLFSLAMRMNPFDQDASPEFK